MNSNVEVSLPTVKARSVTVSPLGFFPRLWKHRDLLISLVRRQFQLRYRQSFAGFGWAIVPPLATLGAATLVFDRVAEIDTKGVAYPIFALAALTPWTFFSNSLMQGIPSVVGGSLMVTRLPFPRAVLPLGAIGASLVDLSVASGLFIGWVYAFGDGLPLTALWAFPLLALEMVLLSGVVLIGASMNVFARDIRLAVPLIAQLWLFLTPVMYPLSAVPRNLRPLYLLNPMTGLIESFRRALVGGFAPEPGMIVPAVIGAFAVLIVGVWYFASTESRFADVI